MTIQEILNNAGLEDYDLIPMMFILETNDKVPNMNKVYFYIHNKENEQPWMCVIENNEIIYLYEIYSNDKNISDELLEVFNLERKADSCYYLKKNLSTNEYEEVWQSESITTYICKNRELKETVITNHNVNEDNYKEICEEYKVKNLLSYGDEYFLVVSTDLDSYQEYKTNLNIDFTF